MMSESWQETLTRLFAEQRLAVLATHSAGQPYGSLVAFAATPDLRHLLFATRRATRKFANLQADARVALLIDNRNNNVADFERAVAVTALGEAEELKGAARADSAALYLARHPHLAEFLASPDGALLRVSVSQYNLVSRFQQVQEIRMAE